MTNYFILIFINLFVYGTTIYASDEVVSDLSAESISINTSFNGSEILIFGSIKRDNNLLIPSNIIIELIGSNVPVIVRKKKKIFGIWVNSDPVEIAKSPSYYSLLYTKRPELILTKLEQKKAGIGRQKFANSDTASQAYNNAIDAIIRIKSNDGSYQLGKAISLKNETLFSATVSLPSNLTEGNYKTIIHLVQNKKIINSSNGIIRVRKIGLEKWLYNFAHEKPLFYGVFSVLLALFSGWSASAIFRRFQH
jgi:uncharacterized protein (TIGR02186 family)